jgi:hypothetical protein
MSYDGENFNWMITRSLRDRMLRLLRDVPPSSLDQTAMMQFLTAHRELFNSEPAPPDLKDSWKLMMLVLAGIYGELIKVAAEFRKTSVGDRGNLDDFAEAEGAIDTEENEWRATLNLQPVHAEVFGD